MVLQNISSLYLKVDSPIHYPKVDYIGPDLIVALPWGETSRTGGITALCDFNVVRKKLSYSYQTILQILH